MTGKWMIPLWLAASSHADYSAWSYYSQITFNTTGTGANVATNQGDFPVLIRLTSSNFDFSHANADGSDLRFEDPDGAALPYQIERWDNAAQLAEVWVKVPQIDGNSSADYIKMYFGNVSAASESNGNNVFPTSNNYVATYHLNEDGNSNANGYVNSTTNGSHLQGVSMANTDDVTAYVGIGQAFDGTNDYIGGTVTNIPINAGSRTNCAWVKSDVTTATHYWMGYGSGTAGCGWNIGIFTSNNWYINANTATVNTGDAADANWHHQCVTYDGATGRYYQDGAEIGNGNLSTLGTASSALRIGADRAAANKWDGIIDEFQIISTNRSADWVKLAYHTQKTSPTAITLGAEIAVAPEEYGADWRYSTRIFFNTTPSGADVPGSQADFPVLIRLNAANFLFDQAQPDGRDIRFADPDGSRLSYEIERWSYALKKAEIWVKVPQVDGNSRADFIRMHWGNSSVSSRSSASSVFGAYKAVYHLQQSPGATAPQFTDASGTANHGTAQAGAAGDSLSAVIGMGYQLNGSSKYVSTATGFANPNTFTVSAWFKSTSASGGGLVGMVDAATGNGASRDRHLYLDNSGLLNFGIENAGTNRVISSTAAYNDGAWHQAVARLAGSGMFLFVDGVQVAANASYTAGKSYTGYWRMGHAYATGWTPAPTSNFLNGALDEIAVSHSALGADWIRLAYQNQRAASNLLTFESTDLSTWAYSNKVYINTTSSGANIAANVANYPLLVRLTGANFAFSQANSDGGDLRFAGSDGSLLPYEIERWDAAGSLGEVWVLIPMVQGNNNTQWFRMYWGKSSAASLSSSNSVFQASGAYKAVWHLGEDGSTVAGAYKDASPWGNHGTGVGLTGSSDVTGAVGKGQTLDGSSTSISVPANAAVGNLIDKFTVSAWIKPDLTNGIYRFFSASRTVSDNGFACGLYTGNQLILTTYSVKDYNTSGLAMTTAWSYVTMVMDASRDVKFYVDGAYQGQVSHTVSGVANTDDGWIIGSGHNGAMVERFDGIVDELRVAGAVRSAEWIKLDYETQKSASTVVSIGTRSSDYSGSVRLNFNTTATGANVGGNVIDFPLLLRVTSSTLDFSATREDGADLQFVDKDGAYLYHEVVDWDKANKTGKVWVKVPQVDGNSTSDYITLYYGCPGCASNAYASADQVFSAYSGIYHLSPSTESRPLDGSPNNNHLSYLNDVPLVAGITAPMAPYFDGTTGNYATVADPADGALDVGTGDFTFSLWFKTAQAPVVGKSPVLAGKYGSAPIYGYDVYFKDNAVPADGGKLVMETYSNGTVYTKKSAAALNDNQWHHVAAKKYSGSIELYIDGVSQGTAAQSLGTLNSSGPLYIGGEDNASYVYSGAAQEFRLAKSNLSADYIKLSYQNQKAADALLSVPISTSSFSGSKEFKFNTKPGGADIPGNVTNFPLLIRLTGPAVIGACQGAGQDIRFLDGDGVTWLDYVIDRWKTTAPESAAVWVRVPQIDGNSTTDKITLLYNDAPGTVLPDGQCNACVFPASDGYAAVWHMGADLNDATSNANNGTNSGTTEAQGAIGTGRYFDGADCADFGNGNSIKTIANIQTVETWLRTSQAAPASGARNIIRHNGHFSPLSLTTASQARSSIWNLTSKNLAFTWDGVFNSDTWQHYLSVYNKDVGLKVYRNGALYASDLTFTGVLATNGTSNLKMGSREACDAEFYTGYLDEVRISTVSRDTNWIKLTYQSQRPDVSPLFYPSVSDFVSSRRIGFNTTRTGADVAGDVENFPLLVRLADANGGLIDAVQANAPDIRFLDADGVTWLDYQVERWDKAQDSAEVWVLIPKVDGNSDRDFITLYYNDVNDGSIGNGECGSCVFSAGNGFTGVWHLGEDGNNAAGGYLDATGNALHGQGTGMSAASDLGAMVGRGQDFDGSSTFITLAANAPMGNLNAGYTVSAWVKADAIAGSIRRLLSARRNTSNDGFAFGVDAAGEPLTTTYNVKDYAAGGSALSTGTWYHLTMVLDTAFDVSFYRDGAFRQTVAHTAGAVSNADDAWVLGNGSVSPGGALQEKFDGILDELRVENVARSADWIRLSYETQRQSGNLFRKTRPGPDNTASLTAAAGLSSIQLSWTLPVSDSANADSVGIWLKYTGPPDSVGAAGQTLVAKLPKTDSTYSYPATYPGSYYFALAVRNTAGYWSPFTAASTDTAILSQANLFPDTIYVDSAIGNDANTCVQARNPATPLLTLETADGCESVASDTLVIRVMPGTYAGAGNDQIDAGAKPVVVTSFDINSRAVLNSSGTGSYDGGTQNWTVFLFGGVTLRNMDVMASVNGYNGVYITGGSGENNNAVEGCRIYGNGSARHSGGIVLKGLADSKHIAGNIVHQPTGSGIYCTADNGYNIVNNTLVGDGSASTTAIWVNAAAFAADATIANNICQNWDYGIYAISNTASTGVVSNNLFHMVTNGRDLSNVTDANKISRDPMLYSTGIRDPNGFKLLPGSPAIDAGTATYASGALACATRYPKDHFGASRSQGSAVDIGAYEGAGFTPNPAADFDTLTNTVSGNTIMVKNSKWKLVWDMARGGGIAGFYDMAGDTTANLVAASSLLFDVRIDAHLASAKTSNSIAPVLVERTRARAVVRQRLALSASLDLNVWYTVHASGHVYIQSEISNLSAGLLDVDAVQYFLKVGTAMSLAPVPTPLSGAYVKNGYGVLATATRDAFLSATQDLDGNGYFSENWIRTGSLAGSTDSVGFSTADLDDPAQSMKRRHHFLLYVGDGSMDNGKAAALNADAYGPSPVAPSAGSLLHERSWQDQMAGHWTLDDGSGTTALDKSVNQANHAAITSGTWVSGKAGGALRFTTASVATVADQAVLEAGSTRTYMLWVKPDFAAMGADAFVLSKGLTTGDGWHFRRVNGASRIKFVMAAQAAQSPILASGTWVHLAGVAENGYLSLYVNGVLAAASTATAAATANSADLLIGKGGGDANAFAGDIDDVRIYHAALPIGQIQSIVQRGFSAQYGHYHLRSDNNNRVVALLNEGATQTRVQPAFQIDNWWGGRAPKYVYMNGVRLAPNIGYVVDTLDRGLSGTSLILQVNQVLTGADQTLFIDDDDSTGYLGESAKMKTLTMTATAGDRIVVRNFPDTVFGDAASGQWHLELDLNGWNTPTAQRGPDSGFGDIHTWKAAAVSPNVAVSQAVQLAGLDNFSGRNLSHMKFHDAGANKLHSGGEGYSSPVNIGYTMVDSSSVRLSLVLDTMTLVSGANTVKLVKRQTLYPTGRLFSSYHIASSNVDMDSPRLDFGGRYDEFSRLALPWSAATALSTGRWGRMGGTLGFHSLAGGVLSVKSAGATVSAPGSMLGAADTSSSSSASTDFSRTRFSFQTGLFQAADDPITVNWVLDISRDFTDSATADSLIKDLQTPAAVTAVIGTANPADALDFNTVAADGFAEGDGAYVYTAASGVAHFRFVNTVAHFNPVFRIKSWAFGTLPEFVAVDNQAAVFKYHYNAFVKAASNELVMQFNKTLAPGTHVFFISHKTGLAVTLRSFTAEAGDGADTLRWITESEFENLGFNIYRRTAAGSVDGDAANPVLSIGADGSAETRPGPHRDTAGSLASAPEDTLASHALDDAELAGLGYRRLNPKLLPGAENGASSTTRRYEFIDRIASAGTAYEYLLEAVDFSGSRTQYGPRAVRARAPLETVLQSNYPNPFNPVTTLRFSLREKTRVSLVIYDARGRTARVLIRPGKPLAAGRYRITWDARDGDGHDLPSGQYFGRFSAGKYHKTRKMLLIR